MGCFLNLEFTLISEQVGSLEEAGKAKEAGVDGIIVQGHEAGGHVIGQVK
jgi:NAD(P)H-dependent flavin oxidoreductase YrpB (nitropropane dioxygenase family)